MLDSENDVKGGTTGPIQIEGGLKSVVVKYRLNFDNKDYVGIIRRWRCLMVFPFALKSSYISIELSPS